MHEVKWFTDRIGKRIYRNESSCPCDSCQLVNEEGLVVEDKAHAQVLHSAQEMYIYRSTQ